MSCAIFQEYLSAELDGDLSADEKLKLEQHLAECASCRSLRDRLARLESGFAQLPESAPPPLRPLPSVTPVPAAAKSGRVAVVATLWSAVLAAAACAAILFWKPGALETPGSELYFCSHELLHQHPHAQPLTAGEFRSAPLHGKVVKGRQLAFEIHLDSDHHACKNLQLEVDYDFDGDGKVDRSEIYTAFDTDDQQGWEVYTHGRGPVSEQGEMKDFQGGTVACRLRNASGNVQVLQGNSKLVLPHRLSV